MYICICIVLYIIYYIYSTCEALAPWRHFFLIRCSHRSCRLASRCIYLCMWNYRLMISMNATSSCSLVHVRGGDDWPQRHAVWAWARKTFWTINIYIYIQETLIHMYIYIYVYIQSSVVSCTSHFFENDSLSHRMTPNDHWYGSLSV